MMNGRKPIKPKGRGPFRNLRRRFATLTASDTFLKVFSLLAAIAVWGVLMASDSTLPRQKTFKAAGLTAVGEGALLTRGFIVTDDLTQLPAVDLTVEVTQENYNRASLASYNPHIDLSMVTGEGEWDLPVTWTSQFYGAVVACKPSTIRLNVERYITRRVPVVVTLGGEMPEGLFLVDYDADPSVLTVSGPFSEVARIARAEVTLDQSALSSERMNDQTALSYVLQEADGTIVPTGKMSVTSQSVLTSTVTVQTRLLPMKKVPIALEGLTIGKPAEGYVLQDAWPLEETVSLAAEPEVLEGISHVLVERPLDITGADATLNGYIQLALPSGIRNKPPAQMGATAVIEEGQIERTFRNVPIVVEGAADGLEIALSVSRTNAQITGGYAFVSGLDPEEIALYVDASGLLEGQHTLPVRVRIDNAQPFTLALGNTEVQATVKAQ